MVAQTLRVEQADRSRLRGPLDEVATVDRAGGVFAVTGERATPVLYHMRIGEREDKGRRASGQQVAWQAAQASVHGSDGDESSNSKALQNHNDRERTAARYR